MDRQDKNMLCFKNLSLNSLRAAIYNLYSIGTKKNVDRIEKPIYITKNVWYLHLIIDFSFKLSSSAIQDFLCQWYLLKFNITYFTVFLKKKFNNEISANYPNHLKEWYFRS